MAAKHWAIGCGAGCLLILIVLAVMIGLGAKFVGDTTSGFEEAVEVNAMLDERFPPPEDYVPPPAPPGPDRLEAFLAVREASGEARRSLSGRFASIPLTREQQEEFEKKGLMKKIGSTLGFMKIGAEMGNFFAARNRALLDNDMGFGEYVYIYAFCYFGWLQMSPGDDFFGKISDLEGVEPSDLDEVSVYDRVLPMIRRQLEAMDATADAEWRALLEQELASATDETSYVPWSAGLPASITAAFEPYRKRAENEYDPLLAAFELMRNEKRGRYSYGVQ